MSSNVATRRPAGDLVPAFFASAVLVVLVLVGRATSPPARSTGAPQQARAAALSAMSLACPVLGLDPASPGGSAAGSAVVAAAAVGPTTATGNRGALVVTPLAGGARLAGDTLADGTKVVSESRRDELLQVKLPVGVAQAGVRATGVLAPGTTAALVTRTTAGGQRGLAMGACSEAVPDAWFVGAGTGTGRRADLLLANPESGPAQVDVSAYGPDGSLGVVRRGMAVAAHAAVVVRLDAPVPAVGDLAVHVVAAQGRVAASLRTTEERGLTPLGVDFVPPAGSPARHLVVPGVLRGSGQRTLHVVAPGGQGAVVQVRLLGPGGPLAAGSQVLSVPAGSVADLDLAAAGGRVALGVELTSDQPVTAGVDMRQGGAVSSGEPGDVAYEAAVEPIRGQALLPWVATGLGRLAEISLTAPGAAARVRLVAVARPGQPVPDGAPDVSVTVAAGSTLVVPLASGVGVPAHGVLVVVEPGSGPVHAGAFLHESAPDGPLLTAMPLRTARSEVELPTVSQDLEVGLPRS